MYNKFIDSQAGIIASDLKDNCPCPVCGSLDHPNPASLDGDYISKHDLDLIKEKLDIDDELEKRIKNTLKFLNIKSKIIKGNIIHIPKTNIAYIEPHKLEINDITYLFFNECENAYINTLEKSIPFNKLETYIKKHKN